jgi:hypothetical protein
MNKDILAYNNAQTGEFKVICDKLCDIISDTLSEAENVESKLWHGHPVWFSQGNPIVGYCKLKNDVQLLFWSGQSFDEPKLLAEGSFKAAQMRYTALDQIVEADLVRWLRKAQEIQWDYKNIVKRRGQLVRLEI